MWSCGTTMPCVAVSAMASSSIVSPAACGIGICILWQGEKRFGTISKNRQPKQRCDLCQLVRDTPPAVARRNPCDGISVPANGFLSR